MKNGRCHWCGQIHVTMCPLVKAIEYFANGKIKRVEFKTAANHVPLPAVLPGRTMQRHEPRFQPDLAPWPATPPRWIA